MMEHKEKTKLIVLVVPSNGFDAYEYYITKEILENAGAIVFTASDNSIEAKATDGSIISIDAGLEIVDVSKYDGIFFIGGPGTMSCLDKPQAYRLVKDARDMGVPYGAIDLAVRILAYGDGLVGKDATGLDKDRKLKEILEASGGRYRATDVIEDYCVVTASTPGDTEKFAHAILDLLRKQDIDAPKHIPIKRS